jgi:hypothetical protein
MTNPAQVSNRRIGPILAQPPAAPETNAAEQRWEVFPSGGQTPADPAAETHLAPTPALPPELKNAPTEVKEAYRFAIANKKLLEQIPGFCGCNAIGHKSNYSCYVAEDGGPGEVL